MAPTGLVRRALDLIAPPSCAACGLPGDVMCHHCRCAVVLPDAPCCLRCGHPWAVPTDRCSECPPALDRVRFAAPYRQPLISAMNAFKEAHRRDLEAFFAERMAVAASPAAGTVLVAVPSTNSRRRTRGYNPAAVLATRLGELWQAPTVELLVRVRNDRAQRGSSRTDRMLNVRGAFACTPGVPVPASVCLIDDVCTTGATLSACARTLRRSGVREVSAVTMARVLRGL